MGRSAVQEVLAQHLESGGLEPGEQLTIRVDQTLTRDATGTMAYLQLEAIGVDRVATELAVAAYCLVVQRPVRPA